MSSGLEVVVLSDLHLGAGRPGIDAPDPFADDDALADLLDHLAARPARLGVRLQVVLLGDIVDFVLVGAGEAPCERSVRAARRDLDAIVAAHPRVFAALGRLAATAGVEIDIVPGNHDMELALPGVKEHLGALTAAASRRPAASVALRVSPWMVHVPGVLHAEHGQQHHDLNRFADLAAGPAARGGALRRLPPAAHVDALLATRSSGSGPRTLAEALVRGVPPLAASLLTLGRPRRPDPPPERREGSALPLKVLHELDRLSAVRRAVVARRLARQALGAACRTRAPSLDLRKAAAKTHALLARSGHSVPYVVFGHTHVPLAEPLGSGATYLNTGTWSAFGPGAGARTVVRVVIEGEGTAPRARLERWDAERQMLVVA